MTAHIPHGSPLMAAAQIQSMAGRAADEKMARFLTGLSVLMVAVMIYRECRDILPWGKQPHQSWRERIEDERGAHHSRERG